MKIAIMTQPLGKNYGGIMQAWALQQVLKRMGHEPVTIDRQYDRKSPLYNCARYAYKSVLYYLGKRIQPASFDQKSEYIFRHTLRFIRDQVKQSEVIDSEEKLKRHFSQNSYSAVVVGSDQTWRPRYSPNIYNFFLDFLQSSTIRKISYAASFGVSECEYNETQISICRNLLKEFSAVSVRESGGQALCDEIFGVTPVYVLDPTLLLEKEDYLSLLGVARKSPGKTAKLFTYWLDRSEKKAQLTCKVAEILSLEAFECYSKDSISTTGSKDIDDYVMPPVEDWISSFEAAEFILTDSFHGVVFSIIFRKPFYAVVNSRRGTDRFLSLLESLGLSDRLIDEQYMNFCGEFSADIDWDNVSGKLAERKLVSQEFLTAALGARDYSDGSVATKSSSPLHSEFS